MNKLGSGFEPPEWLLSQEERARLHRIDLMEALSWVKHYKNLHRDALVDSERAVAKAWDEGYSHCFDFERAGDGASLDDNPYRTDVRQKGSK